MWTGRAPSGAGPCGHSGGLRTNDRGGQEEGKKEAREGRKEGGREAEGRQDGTQRCCLIGPARFQVSVDHKLPRWYKSQRRLDGT